MQIGTRWHVGAEPPARLPDAVKHAIADAESRSDVTIWTLTWLEGRPIVEGDDGTRIPPLPRPEDFD